MAGVRALQDYMTSALKATTRETVTELECELLNKADGNFVYKEFDWAIYSIEMKFKPTQYTLVAFEVIISHLLVACDYTFKAHSESYQALMLKAATLNYLPLMELLIRTKRLDPIFLKELDGKKYTLLTWVERLQQLDSKGKTTSINYSSVIDFLRPYYQGYNHAACFMRHLQDHLSQLPATKSWGFMMATNATFKQDLVRKINEIDATMWSDTNLTAAVENLRLAVNCYREQLKKNSSVRYLMGLNRFLGLNNDDQELTLVQLQGLIKAAVPLAQQNERNEQKQEPKQEPKRKLSA